MSSVFIRHLAEVCREHLLTEKWLVSPSLRVAHQWLEQVIRSGTPVVNVRVKTTRSLALDVLGGALADGAERVASAPERRLVVDAAWHASMDDDGYLGSANVTSRLLALAERTIADLRLAGVTSGDLAPDRFEHPDKGREMGALLEAYERELSERGLIDHADTMRRAAAAVGTVTGDAILLVPEDLRLSALERRFIDAFGDRAVRLPCDDPATERDAPPRTTHAVGEINEVRQALRVCLAHGTPIDQVELLYTAAEPYVPLVLDTALRVLDVREELDLGVPVTFAEGIPARLSRPGRLLSAWLAWIDEGFTQSTLLDMLQAGLLRPPVDEKGDTIGSARLARALRSVGIGFGRERHRRCLDDHVDGLRKRLDALAKRAAVEDGEIDPDQLERTRRRLETAVALRDIVGRLADASPDESTPPEAIVESAMSLIADLSRISGPLDALARHHVLEELRSMRRALAEAPDDRASSVDVWTWLAQLPDTLRVAGSGPRPGHLHVASVRSGGHSGRPSTIILGLDDGRFPPTGLQDPLVLDAERRSVSKSMPTSSDRVRDAIDDFARLLARLRGDVTLSFSSRSVTDDRETFASPVVLSAFRTRPGRADADHAQLIETLDAPASFAPAREEECLDAADWWLMRGTQARPVANLGVLAAAAYPHLTRGREATAARDTDAFTVYDGRVLDPAPQLDPRHPDGPIMSATSKLHALGECPLRYFQRQILEIKPPDDVAVDASKWLDALQFGTMMHDVLYDFVGELIADDTWPPVPERDLPRIAAVVERHVEQWRRRVPSPNDEAYRRQRRDIDRTAEIFVNEQARDGGGTRPRFLEASFGMRPQDRGSAVDTLEPVPIDLPGGGRIRARARIDRIDDKGGDGLTFVIVDYKSGGYVKRYAPADDYNEGRLLQHVLYLEVAQRVLREHFGPDARVDEFVFLFPGPRTHGRAVTHGRRIVPGGVRIIEQLCTLIENGAFPATTDTGDCRFCDYRAGCHAVDRDLEVLCARTKRKISAGDAALAPFGELRK